MKKYPEQRIKVPRFKEENGFYTTKKRSGIMKQIKSKDTKPEISFRKSLWSLGVRYRKNVRNLPGSPDIAIKKYKLAIFIDGEFWHGFNWQEKKMKIKKNRDFWIPKIERNMQRDREINDQYLKMGWTVFRFWQHEIKNELHVCLNKVLDCINHLEKYPNQKKYKY